MVCVMVLMIRLQLFRLKDVDELRLLVLHEDVAVLVQHGLRQDVSLPDVLNDVSDVSIILESLATFVDDLALVVLGPCEHFVTAALQILEHKDVEGGNIYLLPVVYRLVHNVHSRFRWIHAFHVSDSVDALGGAYLSAMVQLVDHLRLNLQLVVAFCDGPQEVI